MIKHAIAKIVDKQDLTYDEAYEVMNEIMSGQTSPTQNAAFLAALSTKSTKAETIDEISGCATAMRDHATPVEHPGLEVLDIVGTVGFGIATPQQAAAMAKVSDGAIVRHHQALCPIRPRRRAPHRSLCARYGASGT